MSDNTETAILAGGCFWGVEELLRQRDGIISTRVGYTGGRERPPDLPEPPGSRRGGRDRLRSREDLLPGHPRVLLPDPRPVDQGPPGQRHRVLLPLRDLLHERRAAPGRRGDDRRRRRLGPVARQGRDRGQRGRHLLGGRARAPGLPPEVPQRLHLPLPAAGLEAAAPRDRGLTSGVGEAGQDRAEGQPARAGLHELRRPHHPGGARVVPPRRRRAAVLRAGRRAGHHVLGHRERLPGRDLGGGRRPRDQALLAARGHRVGDEAVRQDARRPGWAGPVAQGGLEQIDASLARLGTDYVDLYQIHRFDPEPRSRRRWRRCTTW